MEIVVDIGGGPNRVVGCLYAWIATDPETGLEGICSIGNGNVGFLMQAATSELRLAKMMEPEMQSIAKIKNVKIRLQKFIFSGTVTEVNP